MSEIQSELLKLSKLGGTAIPIFQAEICAEAYAELTRLTSELSKARVLLESLVDDEPCRTDHHGYCQTHNLSHPCEVAEARRYLKEGGR